MPPQRVISRRRKRTLHPRKSRAFNLQPGWLNNNLNFFCQYCKRPFPSVRSLCGHLCWCQIGNNVRLGIITLDDIPNDDNYAPPTCYIQT